LAFNGIPGDALENCNVQNLTAKDAKGRSDFNVRTADECECTQIE
jgi:hypothetical protein